MEGRRVRLEVLKGDITASDCEALVNAANTHLWMGSGVAGALKRAGGVSIEREAMSKGPIRVGSAVATSAGRLPARCVIHAAVMGSDLNTCAAYVKAATLSALRLADEMGMRSVALPAFGTGVGGLPPSVSAAAMKEAVSEWMQENGKVERVCLVLFSDALKSEFARVFQGLTAREDTESEGSSRTAKIS